MEAGLSTLGITFGYGVETEAGKKPTSFKALHRINEIGEINLDPNTIDASALEDFITRTIEGRADTGGTCPITVNLTSETEAEWNAVISEQAKLSGGKRIWWETIVPGMANAFFFVAQVPKKIPQPSFAQNGLLTVAMNLTIDEYVGLDAKVDFEATA